LRSELVREQLMRDGTGDVTRVGLMGGHHEADASWITGESWTDFDTTNYPVIELGSSGLP